METNDLRHTININNDQYNCKIEIRLNDECKNGHEDFAITATFWTPGKRRSDRYFEMGGCCHEEIMKVRPDFKQFIDLHLSDFNGAPMYAVANGLYHMRQSEKGVGQRYLKATNKQFELLNTAEDKEHLTYLIEKSGLDKDWKKQANKAIKELEKLTGKIFKSKATKSHYAPLNKEQSNVLKNRIKNGYYSKEQKNERKKAKIDEANKKIIAEAKEECDKIVAQAMTKYELIKQLVGFSISTKNMIYYNHTNKVVFNWKDYEEKMSESEFNWLIENLDYSKFSTDVRIELKGVVEHDS